MVSVSNPKPQGPKAGHCRCGQNFEFWTRVDLWTQKYFWGEIMCLLCLTIIEIIIIDNTVEIDKNYVDQINRGLENLPLLDWCMWIETKLIWKLKTLPRKPLLDLGLILPHVTRIFDYFHWFCLEKVCYGSGFMQPGSKLRMGNECLHFLLDKLNNKVNIELP